MTPSRYAIRRLNESTWDAFAALVEANGGIFGGCWCMGFHPADHSHADAAEPNRERKLDRVGAGTASAALVFDGADHVGWCRFGAPDEVPRGSPATSSAGAIAARAWLLLPWREQSS